MKTSELLHINNDYFNQMTEKELRKVVSTITRTANKRLVNFNKHNYNSPATRAAFPGQDTAFKFESTKSMNINQLRKQYGRVKRFLTSETGNVKGWQKARKNIIKQLEEKGNVKGLNESNFDEFFRLYNKYKEINPTVSNRQLKYKIMKDMVSMIEQDFTGDKLVEELNKNIEQTYKEMQEEYSDVTGVSSFFE